jgi:hypothetical protein
VFFFTGAAAPDFFIVLASLLLDNGVFEVRGVRGI